MKEDNKYINKFDACVKIALRNELLSRFHDLRHTCASLLLNKGKHEGITLKDIQVWLGHSDFSTTANTYSHLDATSKGFSLGGLEKAVTL